MAKTTRVTKAEYLRDKALRDEADAARRDTVTLPRSVVEQAAGRLESASRERHRARQHVWHGTSTDMSTAWEKCDEGPCMNDKAALVAFKEAVK